MGNDLIVVGGGAAGMFAAIQAGYAGAKVLLLEPNDRLGKKLYITGKGRCNLTNNCPWQEVLKNVPRNSRFLYSALSGFTPEDAITFFESHGCETKTERGNRVFPVTDKSASVVDALKTALDYAGVEVRRARAEEILTGNDCVPDASANSGCGSGAQQVRQASHSHVIGVRTDRGDFFASAVILATGGKSYPATGSTGDGYRLAEALGHTVVPPVGSLVPLVEDGGWCAKMQGLALKNVSVRLYESLPAGAPTQSLPLEGKVPPQGADEVGPVTRTVSKPVFEEFGELLFTHFGLSGPVILSASAHMEAGKRYTVTIDLKPALDEATLDARILRDFADNHNRSFENALSGLYPKTMIPVIVERSGIPGSTKVHSVTREQRRVLLDLTKHFTIRISGKRPVEEAIVTSGGISVKEVNPKTMESRLVPGLYFAGEILDVDAYTGGFNLQIAWATAYAAGHAAAERRPLPQGGT